MHGSPDDTECGEDVGVKEDQGATHTAPEQRGCLPELPMDGRLAQDRSCACGTVEERTLPRSCGIPVPL